HQTELADLLAAGRHDRMDPGIVATHTRERTHMRQGAAGAVFKPHAAVVRDNPAEYQITLANRGASRDVDRYLALSSGQCIAALPAVFEAEQHTRTELLPRRPDELS